MTRFRLIVLAVLALWSVGAAAQSMVEGSVEAGQSKATACAACHGANGNSNNPKWPNLAGQHAQYVKGQLQLYKSKKRANNIMYGQAAKLSEQDMADIAAYYKSLEAEVGGTNEELVEQGASIYRGGIPAKGVPACSACHGPAGRGNPGVPYPRLSGQKAEYVAGQLTAYRSGERSGYEAAETMNTIAQKMSDEQIQAVSSYVSGLFPGKRSSASK